ncbi:hypothetical protein HMPREF1584_00901 [Gardnerella vaginalis JCP8481A]|nr:hypothetical protein HMPREF1584_00901 [Gardnerella vaginalis JCP8481A]EPI42878.1 hypothetical protein HMPREF1585_00649 [Gardnerella vaginalis JCP8481B]
MCCSEKLVRRMNSTKSNTGLLRNIMCYRSCNKYMCSTAV